MSDPTQIISYLPILREGSSTKETLVREHSDARWACHHLMEKLKLMSPRERDYASRDAYEINRMRHLDRMNRVQELWNELEEEGREIRKLKPSQG